MSESVLHAPPAHEEQTECALCGLSAVRTSNRLNLEGKTYSFCCTGCLSVFRILHDRPEGPPSDYRETALFRAALSAGVIPARDAVPAMNPEHEKSGSYPEELVREFYFNVEGMWCTACAFLIQEVLERQRGIVHAEVSFFSDLVRIRYLPHRTDPDAAMDQVARLGYRPSLPEEHSENSTERRRLLMRLGVSSILTVNIMMISFSLYAGFFHDLGEIAIAYLSITLWVMCSGVLFYGGSPVLQKALGGLRHGVFSMDTLISAGALSAYAYSISQMIKTGLNLYFDTAAMLITVVLLGRFIELRARDSVNRGINELYRLARQKVRLLVNGKERWVLPDAVHKGDTFEVRNGERISVDGRILSGKTIVDESFLTGESRPVTRVEGHTLRAGSLILGDDVKLEASASGVKSTLHQMVRLLQDALALKNPAEMLADRITKVAVPAVLLIAAFTALSLPASGASWGESILRGVTVLVITCPCAFGIATPLARVAFLGTARKRGILIGRPDALETSKRLKAMVLDKTGTVTEGRFALRHIITTEGQTMEEALIRAASVETHSDHFIAREILERAKGLSLLWPSCDNFQYHEGLGVKGLVKGSEVLAGSRRFIRSRGITIASSMDQNARELECSGHTVIFVAWDGRMQAMFSFGDVIREDTADAVAFLQAKGIEVWLVSGDSTETTAQCAETLKIKHYSGQALPADKVEIVRNLQRRGLPVGMVGDGVNDAAAIAQADVGFSLGARTNLLQKAGDVTLLTANLRKVVETLHLSAFTMRIIRQNLFFSFFYNGLGIPLAIAGFLNPVIAIIAMFASSISVIGNTIRITKRKEQSA